MSPDTDDFELVMRSKRNKKAVQGDTNTDLDLVLDDNDDDDDIGPMLLVNIDTNANTAGGNQTEKAQQKDLLPGEG